MVESYILSKPVSFYSSVFIDIKIKAINRKTAEHKLFYLRTPKNHKHYEKLGLYYDYSLILLI